MHSLKILLVAAVLAPLTSWADPLSPRSMETVSEVVEGLRLEAQRRRREGSSFTQEEIRANQQRLAQARPDEGGVADDGFLGVVESLEKMFCSRSCDPRCRVIQVKQIGEENRKPLNDQGHAAFAGVGRVVCKVPGAPDFTSTATIVGNRRTVVGSGHFRSPEWRGTPVPLDDCLYELYDSSGRTTFSSKIRRENTPAPAEEYLRFSTSREDWSVLTLEKEVPSSVPIMPIAGVSLRDLDRSDVFLVGFHTDPRVSPRRKFVSPNCRPRLYSSRQTVRSFSHTCDTSPGASGSLLYIQTAQGPVAVAIHQGEASDGNDFNFGQIFRPSMIAAIPGASAIQFAELTSPSQSENY